MERRKILCCWQADGNGDRMSIWMRSVGFHSVLEEYQKIWERQDMDIVDITNWKDWEKDTLEYGNKLYQSKKRRHT